MMKKRLLVTMLSIIICLFGVYGLTGCDKKIETPTINDNIVNNYIEWNEVSNADSYLVRINEYEKNVGKALGVFISEIMDSHIQAGETVECYISVKAKTNSFGYSDSDWSSPFAYTYKKADETPLPDLPPDISNKEIDNILDKMSVKQAEDGAEFVGASLIGDIAFLQYKIGEINGCFIQKAATAFQKTSGLKTYKLSIQEIKSETIQTGLTNTISLNEFTHVKNEDKDTVSWEFSDKAGLEAKIGVSFGPFDESVKSSLESTAKYNENHENYTYEEVAKNATYYNESTKNIDILNEQLKAQEWEYDCSQWSDGLYYTVCLVADVDVHQIIAYDKANDKLYTTYFYAKVSECALSMLSADNLSFSIPDNYRLSPITEISKSLFDDAEEQPAEPNSHIFDLRNYQNNEKADLSSYNDANYNSETHTFELDGSINNLPIGRYVFKGLYNLQDSRGISVHTRFDGVALQINSEHDLEIVFENIYFIGKSGVPTIYCNEKIANKDIKITITSKGLGNYIFGADGNSSDINGMPAIKVKNLELNGDARITFGGGNGMNGKAGESGGNGYDSPQKKDGGNESNREHMAGGDGINGKNGTNGGDGGDAVIATGLTIQNISCTFIGGNGARGGKGGNGGKGGKGGDGAQHGVIYYNWGGRGGRGGDGGKGGDGGRGGKAVNSSSGIYIYNADVTFEVGKAGDGGRGGNGGKGGQGGGDDWWKDVPKAAPGGDGGNGGNGGNVYATQTRQSIVFTADSSSSVDFITANKAGNAGEGGDKGLGGEGGIGTGYSGLGDDGYDGKRGNPGSQIS